MKYLFLLLSTFSLQAQDVAQSIFNGKDLTGWKVECLEADIDKKYWSVRDGAITVDTKKDKNHDYVWLTYQKEISDFELTVKVRSIRKTNGNSGIQIRSRYSDMGSNAKKRFYLNGPQIDIHPPSPFRIGLIYDETMGIQRWIYPSMKNSAIKPSDAFHHWSWQRINEDGSYTTITDDKEAKRLVPLTKEEIKAGWNHIKIRASGDIIQTWLNGQSVAKHDGKNDLHTKFHKQYQVGKSGRISLQLHSGNDLAMQFRDIMLTELSSE